MPTLLILTKDHREYHAIVEAAGLPDLKIASEPTAECEIVLGAPSLIRTALGSLPNLKWAQATWAGVEPLLDPALRRDYILTNARGVFGYLMSEYVVGYLLAHERKIFQRAQAQKNQEWDKTITGVLRGKTIGLLGVGSIGAEVARTAKFFGMKVRGYTRESELSEHVDGYYHGNGLLEFANGLDYLVSILPNTGETQSIVNAELLSALPPHAVFINVGRGSAVDEHALIEALEQDKIAGAVLDVFEEEPLPKEHPFWTTKNLLMTFHTSAPSFPADIAKIFIENYRLYIEGKPLKHQVDFERGY
ncbi:MAG: D-2-hydroxyacid dehydrogenase [Chloroflexi bacterium]|nr:D-2-hydroxyacid dehydrogenase [Chloroflexota bacterium]MDL1941403.1 D-2-hydroxyacid dehydrogenase [Chloroflexi bacterium CFX2]